MIKLGIRKIIDNRIFHIFSTILDVTSITYFFISTLYLEDPIIPFELFLGFYFLLEFILLFLENDKKLRFLRSPITISNIMIIAGYLIAPITQTFGFLNILRVLRVIQIFQILPDIRVFTKNAIIWEKFLIVFFQTIVLVFLFSEVVLVSQIDINPNINNRFDSFYYTASILTNFISGDVELVGNFGKILSLFIVLTGIGLIVQIFDVAKEVQEIKASRRKKDRENKVEGGDNEDEWGFDEEVAYKYDSKNRRRIIEGE